MSEVIASFEKNSFEEVRISLTNFKGKDLIDLRVYYRPDDGEEMRPTKKGITISLEKFSELKNAILALEKALPKKETWLKSKPRCFSKNPATKDIWGE